MFQAFHPLSIGLSKSTFGTRLQSMKIEIPMHSEMAALNILWWKYIFKKRNWATTFLFPLSEKLILVRIFSPPRRATTHSIYYHYFLKILCRYAPFIQFSIYKIIFKIFIAKRFVCNQQQYLLCWIDFGTTTDLVNFMFNSYRGHCFHI